MASLSPVTRLRKNVFRRAITDSLHEPRIPGPKLSPYPAGSAYDIIESSAAMDGHLFVPVSRRSSPPVPSFFVQAQEDRDNVHFASRAERQIRANDIAASAYGKPDRELRIKIHQSIDLVYIYIHNPNAHRKRIELAEINRNHSERNERAKNTAPSELSYPCKTTSQGTIFATN